MHLQQVRIVASLGCDKRHLTVTGGMIDGEGKNGKS